MTLEKPGNAMTEDRLSIGDTLAYGFGILVYVLLINLAGGALLGIGLNVLESGSPVAEVFGFGLVAIGGSIIAAGSLGILYKIVVDGVRRGMNPGDDADGAIEDEGIEVIPQAERGELTEAESLVEAVVARLREERVLRTRELTTQLYPEHTLGYDDAEEWYDRVESLLSSDDRIELADGAGTRWTLATRE